MCFFFISIPSEFDWLTGCRIKKEARLRTEVNIYMWDEDEAERANKQARDEAKEIKYITKRGSGGVCTPTNQNYKSSRYAINVPYIRITNTAS